MRQQIIRPHEAAGACTLYTVVHGDTTTIIYITVPPFRKKDHSTINAFDGVIFFSERRYVVSVCSASLARDALTAAAAPRAVSWEFSPQ